MRTIPWLATGLIVLTAAVYAPVMHHDFITYDDPAYISHNPRVLGGPTAANLAWGLTADVQASWGPLTQWTLMAQATLLGDRPGGYHAVDAAAHALNAVLLLLLLNGMTARPLRSAVVAVLFAVHPMHVESVAWASEWKDVLSTALALAALLAYVRYTRGGRRRWIAYAATLALAALSLLAKPMYVTLPALMLLLDAWPLRRAASRGAWGWLVVEKLPLAALAAVASVAAVMAQVQGGAVAAAEALPLGARLGHAAIAYWLYLAKLLMPVDLAVFYPHPLHESTASIAAAALGLVGVSAMVLWLRRRRPYLAVGWFWFLGMLVPVIGLVQVGAQSMADRYSYFPSIGLFIAAVWWLADVAGAGRAGRVALGGLAVAVIGWLAVLARRQVDFWQDTQTLFAHAAAVTADNWVADMELGSVAAERHDPAMAAGYYAEVIRLRPSDPRGYQGLADAVLASNPAEAAWCYRRAVALDPNSPTLRLSLARALYDQGRADEALPQVRAALRLDSGSDAARAAERDVLRELARERGGVSAKRAGPVRGDRM